MQPLFCDHPPDSLCLMRLSAVGDVCNAVPLVRALQDHWPTTRITWIVGQLESTLVGDIPGIEFITFNKRDGWRAFVGLRRQLRGRRFDALLHIQAALRSSIASRMLSSPVRVGFDRARARDFQWLFCNRRVAALERAHVLEGFMGFADFMGVPHDRLRWDLPVAAADRAFAARHIGDSEKALIVSPCSSQRSRNWRNWSAGNYAALAEHATNRHGLKVILTGGPSELERRYGEEIGKVSRAACCNLIGQTSLKQLLALLERATVLVCPDSGPAHMATAVDLPVIGLYATSNPDRTGPYLSRRWVVNRYPDAARKYLGKDPGQLRWGQRVRHPHAMELITRADVTGKLDELMHTLSKPPGVPQ